MAEVIQLKISFAILKFKQLLYNIVYNIYWKIKYNVAVTNLIVTIGFVM